MPRLGRLRPGWISALARSRANSHVRQSARAGSTLRCRLSRSWGGFPTFAAVALVSLLLGAAGAAAVQQKIHISQKNQEFRPGSVDIKRGDALEIVNDDDDLLHHAYVDSDKFKFDSGDQEPGQTVEIVFPVTGTFTVLCGIHPRMKLKVHVE